MFLLANEGVTATQWVLLGLILVLIILYPIFTVYRNRKEKDKFENLAKDLKIGDKILTSSGTYGEIVSISEREYGKVLTIKTGDDKNFGYMAVDVLTVYTVFRDKPLMDEEDELIQDQNLSEEEVEVEIVAQKEVQEVKEEKPAPKKETKSKKTTTKKSSKK